MTKISKKAAYPVKDPVRKDYFVGTDSENNGKTVNFEFESTAKLINELNGTPILNYIFRTDSNIDLTVLTEGVFLSAENETTIANISKLYINKNNFHETNMSDLFRFVSVNRESFLMKLRNSSNLSNAVYFRITDATEFESYFILDVAVEMNNASLLELTNFNVYFFDFELSSSDLAITLPEFNKIVTQTGYTSTETTITFNPSWTWLIKNVSYENSASVVKTIAPTTTGKKRIDVFVLNTSNTFETISGEETTGSPVKPQIPADTLEVTFCIVGDTGIDSVEPIDLSSYATIDYVNTKDALLSDRITTLEEGDSGVGLPIAITDVTGLTAELAVKVTQTEIDSLGSQLLGGAPSDANTLKELNDKILAVQAIIGGTTADGDALVNTVAELLAVFATFPEGVDLVTLLAGKVNTTDVYNALDCVIAGKVADARQLKVLNDLIVALTTVVGGKQSALGYTPENTANKSDSYTVSSPTTYTSTKALVDGLESITFPTNKDVYSGILDPKVVDFSNTEDSKDIDLFSEKNIIKNSEVYTNTNNYYAINGATINQDDVIYYQKVKMVRVKNNNYYSVVFENQPIFTIGKRYMISYFIKSNIGEDYVFDDSQAATGSGHRRRYIDHNVRRIYTIGQATSTSQIDKFLDPTVPMGSGTGEAVYFGNTKTIPTETNLYGDFYFGGVQIEELPDGYKDGIIWIGDSTISSDSGGVNYFANVSIPTLTSDLLNCSSFNKAVGGESTSQMDARWNADVTPLAVNSAYVVIQGGINDIVGQNRTLAEIQGSFNSMNSKAIADGLIPVFLTCSPINSNNITKEQIRKDLNIWLKQTFPRVIDINVVIDYNDKLVKGFPKINYNNDEIHYGITLKKAVASYISLSGFFEFINPSKYQKTTSEYGGNKVISKKILVNKSNDDGNASNVVQVNGNITANAATDDNHVVIKSQIDGKANLSGGNTFTGDQNLNNNLRLFNGVDYTKISKVSGALGRTIISAPASEGTEVVSFGGLGGELYIRGGLGRLAHSGSTFSVTGLATNLRLQATSISSVLVESGGNYSVSVANNIASTTYAGTRNTVFQNGGTFTDNGVDIAQFTGSTRTTGQIKSTLATGTSPFVVASTTLNTNLNADMLDGLHASSFAPLASPTLTGTPTAPTATAGTNTTQIANTKFVTDNFASQNGTILYHSAKWFTPTSTVSTTGETVTSVGTQFTSAMVGAKLIISGEERIITAYTSTTVVTVNSAYTSDYLSASSWGVYSKAYETTNGTNTSLTYSKTGATRYYLDLNENFISTSPFTVFNNLSGTSFFTYGTLPALRFAYTNNSSLADIGLNRNSAGWLETYNGLTKGNLKGQIIGKARIGTVYQTGLTTATNNTAVTSILADTTGFPATGTILIGGVTSVNYTSKTTTTFIFASTTIPTYAIGTEVLLTAGASDISYTEILPTGQINISNKGLVDLAISRSDIGILEINNGTAGTLRDLRLRNTLTDKVLCNTTTDNGVDVGQFNGTVSGSDATLSNQFVTKSQLDAVNTNAMLLTGNQTFTGTKSATHTGSTASAGAFNLTNNNTNSNSSSIFLVQGSGGNGLIADVSGTSTGIKIFTRGTTSNGISIEASGTGLSNGINVYAGSNGGSGIQSTTQGAGRAYIADIRGSGDGVYVVSNSGTGRGVYTEMLSTGDGITSNIFSTGLAFVGKNSGATTFSVDKLGNITGNKLNLQVASNASAGNATLVAGTVTVTTTAATTNSIVMLTRKTTSAISSVAVDYTVTNGSFTITSANNLDTSTYSYFIIN